MYLPILLVIWLVWRALSAIHMEPKMDPTSLLTIAGIVLANIGTTIGLFVWSSNHATSLTQAHREDVRLFSQETQSILKSIADEMKDFHGRLCAIEERARSK